MPVASSTTINSTGCGGVWPGLVPATTDAASSDP
jgi:hypothetical protein